MSDPTLQPLKWNNWHKELNRYHWWVLLLCVLGWMFDTMDQRIFLLARNDAMKEIIENQQNKGKPEVPAAPPTEAEQKTLKDAIASSGRSATMWFIYGWATGGLLFGMLGDKIGRARTMTITILVYALFTAVSGFSQTLLQFNIFRFLTGMGVGGEFAAGVALLAEVIPERPRPYALGLMQGLSAVGNITGSMIGIVRSKFVLSWRFMFYMGAFPALLVVLIRKTLVEPESWVKAKAQSKDGLGKQMGSYWDLLSHPRWRKNALFGIGIAVVGVTGLWGISFYTPELISNVQTEEFAAHPEIVLKSVQGEATPENIKKAETKIRTHNSAVMTIFQDIGAFFSMYGFALLSAKIGRKKTFYICCIMGFLSVVLVFGYFTSASQIWWMGTILGFGTLSFFGGYAIYFPELFPTRLRSTGVSLCYNVGRYLAGFIQGPFPTLIKKKFFDPRYPKGLTAYRATNISMSLIYFVGILIVFFAPETHGKPLPTDEDEESAGT